MIRRLIGLLLALGVLAGLGLSASAEDSRYYLGRAVNAGKDTGYSGTAALTEKDPHFGWELGQFYLTGFTQVKDDADCPVFLKTPGDTVTLWFDLGQDIDRLNGDESLCIWADEDGSDRYFGVEKTDLGRGALLIRRTDYQNRTTEPVIYTDYLPGCGTCPVQVELCEEGDYEVALDYSIRQKRWDLLGWEILPGFADYRIFIRFSVRNGSCMVYPFDTVTGQELTNTAVTENGFYLDLARSRYLEVNIRREILTEGADGLTEDVRFNRPARDGDRYTEEGIYTVTVYNRYTDQQTQKVIYVGRDDVLKAHAATGLSIPEIRARLAAGEELQPDGTLRPAEKSGRLPLILGCICGGILLLWLLRPRRRKRWHI